MLLFLILDLVMLASARGRLHRYPFTICHHPGQRGTGADGGAAIRKTAGPWLARPRRLRARVMRCPAGHEVRRNHRIQWFTPGTLSARRPSCDAHQSFEELVLLAFRIRFKFEINIDTIKIWF